MTTATTTTINNYNNNHAVLQSIHTSLSASKVHLWVNINLGATETLAVMLNWRWKQNNNINKKNISK